MKEAAHVDPNQAKGMQYAKELKDDGHSRSFIKKKLAEKGFDKKAANQIIHALEFQDELPDIQARWKTKIITGIVMIVATGLIILASLTHVIPASESSYYVLATLAVAGLILIVSGMIDHNKIPKE
jgi:hypothetical protein